MKVRNLASTLLALLISNVALAAQPNWLSERSLPANVSYAVHANYSLGRHDFDAGGISDVRYFEVENLKGKNPLPEILGKLIQQTRVVEHSLNPSALVVCETWDGESSKESIADDLREEGLSRSAAKKKATKIWRHKIVAPCVKKMFESADPEKHHQLTYDTDYELGEVILEEFNWDDDEFNGHIATIVDFIDETVGSDADVFTARTDYIADIYQVFAISKDRKKVIFLQYDIGA